MNFFLTAQSFLLAVTTYFFLIMIYSNLKSILISILISLATFTFLTEANDMICMSCFITGCVRPTVAMCHRVCPRDCPRKTMFNRLAIENGLRKFYISPPEQDSRGCSNFGCISGGCYAPEYCARVCPSHCSKRTMFRNLAIGNGLKEKLSKKQDSSELEQRLEKLENIVKNQVNTTHSSESRDFSYSFCLSKMLQKLSYYLGRWKHKVVVNSKGKNL